MKFAKLIGDEARFSVEHRILNIILLIGFALAVSSGIFNYLLSIGPVMIGVSTACSLFVALVYYISTVKKKFSLAIRLLAAGTIFIITPAMWFYNGGILGGTSFYILIFSSMLVTLLQGKTRVLGVGSLLLVSLTLILIEYKNPAWISGYSSNAERYADVSISLLFTLIANACLFGVILNHYIQEKNKAQQYFAQVERQNMEKRLARLDRLNVIGEMAASIGHEVRNPMTTVRGFLQLFQRNKNFSAYKDQLDIMIAEIDRANGIIREFLALAKDKVIHLQMDNLNRIINMIYPLLEADALLMGRKFTVELGEIPDVLVDENEIRQCIFNLVRNAFEATEEGGVVTLITQAQEGKAILKVKDNGKGIPHDVYIRLGTPFVTTKPDGTGLGLPVCYRIAERHNAEVEVETGPKGTVFTMGFKAS